MQKQEHFHSVKVQSKPLGPRGGQGLCFKFHLISVIPGNTVALCWNICSILTGITALLTKASALSIIWDSLGSKRGLSVGRIMKGSPGETGREAVLFQKHRQVVLRNSLVALKSCPSLPFPNPPTVGAFCLLFLPVLLQCGALNSRGSSRFPGGFYALHWEEKLLTHLQNAVNEPCGKTQKTDGCPSVRGPSVQSCLMDSSIYCMLWQSTLGLLHERQRVQQLKTKVRLPGTGGVTVSWAQSFGMGWRPSSGDG